MNIIQNVFSLGCLLVLTEARYFVQEHESGPKRKWKGMFVQEDKTDSHRSNVTILSTSSLHCFDFYILIIRSPSSAAAAGIAVKCTK